MALEALDRAPALEDFTLLAEHQEQTPGSFFDRGKAVLHFHARASTVTVVEQSSSEQPAAAAALTALTTLLTGSNSAAAAAAASSPEIVDGNVSISHVDVWVTSSHLLLYSPPHSSGVQISYPAITVTAQDGRDVLLELNLSDADTPDQDIHFLQLRIHPTPAQHDATGADQASVDGARINGTTTTTTTHNDVSTALFKAISDCQELNPDPPGMGDEDEDGEGGFDDTAPGATGWITSENMADFMDENGNFKMPESVTVLGGDAEEHETQQSLGAGAGRARTAAEADAEDGAVEDETKWQRTG